MPGALRSLGGWIINRFYLKENKKSEILINFNQFSHF